MFELITVRAASAVMRSPLETGLLLEPMQPVRPSTAQVTIATASS